jgi:hypothetical protein
VRLIFVIFVGFLIVDPLAAFAQGPKKNPCDEVDFTKKWQCETDRIQADKNRERVGPQEEQQRLSCQRLGQFGDSCHARMKPADCMSFQQERAECVLRGWWRRGPDKLF